MFVTENAKKKLKVLVSGVFACALAFGITGCGGQQQTESQPEPEPEKTYRILGTESDDALSMVFTNDTDKEIVGLATKQSDVEAETYGKDLLASEEPWAAGEEVKLFCEDYDVDEVALAEDSPITDMELLPTYDIQMTFADLTTAVLHDVTFHEAEEVQIHLDATSGVAYMTYLELDESETSTLQAELAVKAAAEAEAAAALQAQQEAEAAAAAAAAAAQQQSSSGSGSRDYSYSSGNSGSGSGTGSGAGQSQDSCISPDDLVLNE